MQKFTLNSSDIHYEILGDGKPIIFLHGFLEDHSIWKNIYPTFLTKGFQIILIDLPCHGLSRCTRANCSMSDMALILHQFLVDKKISNPFVFGHSMGGYVGLELLRLRAIKLTLIHSNFWADSDDKKRDRNRLAEVIKKNKNFFLSEAIPNLFAVENRKKQEVVIQELIDTAGKIPSPEIIAATAGIRDRNASYDLMNTNKINIIQGSIDPVIPGTILETELKKLEKLPYILYIENCGHMSFIEQPAALINHLKSVVIE